MRLGVNEHRAEAAGCIIHNIDDTQHEGSLWACMQGLLGMGAAVNARDKSGGTPLSTTAEECDRGRAAVALLAAGANVRAKNAAGEAPLYIAALRGHADLVQLLLAYHEQCGIAWTVGNHEPALLCCLIHSGMKNGSGPAAGEMSMFLSMAARQVLMSLRCKHLQDLVP